MPDEDYLKREIRGFSGLLIKEDWKGNFLKAYKARNSIYEEVVISSNNSSDGSKINCTYGSYERKYYECHKVVVDGVKYHDECVLVYKVEVCIEEPSLAPPTFTDPGGAGGIEPENTNCEDLEGYIVDENGNCIKWVEEELDRLRFIHVELIA